MFVFKNFQVFTVEHLLYDPRLHEHPCYSTFSFDPGKNLTMYFEPLLYDDPRFTTILVGHLDVV